mgnify:CR=1 FL=1
MLSYSSDAEIDEVYPVSAMYYSDSEECYLFYDTCVDVS